MGDRCPHCDAKLPYIPELITRKTGGPEKGRLETADLKFYEAEYERLRSVLQTAFEESRLPEVPTAAAALNDLLVRVRLAGLQSFSGRKGPLSEVTTDRSNGDR